MKIIHISDTHGFHNYLKTSDNYDIVIHSGDCSNYRDSHKNIFEVMPFIEWYKNFPATYKIYVAGNHDSSIESKAVKKEDFEKNGIIYLQDESINLNGFNIYGSPYTPNFCNWSFMKDRAKLHDVWAKIPDNTDILITHGPPKGILDLSENRDGLVDFCGCAALLKRVKNLDLKLHCFGHIHNGHSIVNTGTRKYDIKDTIFSNASGVEDGKFDKNIVFHGNTFVL